MNNQIDITIVIPFHDEEKSLNVLIPLLMNVIRSVNKSFEVLLVDDKSSDASIEVIAKFRHQYSEIKLIQLNERGGQTGCYDAAFKEARGKYILRMDADLQDDPRDIPEFIEKIDQGSDLIMGLRECRKHTKIIRMSSAIYDLIILSLFNSPLHSNSGSYVAFKSNLMKDIPFRKNDHRYLPLIAIRRGATNISEVFVRHNERKWGESKYKPIRKIILGLPEVIFFLFRYINGNYDIDRCNTGCH